MRKITDKIYGGIDMKWWKVIVFAFAAAVLTTVFLVVPVFENTSFREMGVTFEAWIFFAVIIMVNCKSPLDSALKTFVFFLISQPLIYLFQVPFYRDGFRIFMYYPHWFMLTLFTFPLALVGWFLKKGNWLSLLILTPVNLFLGYMGLGYLTRHVIPNMPNHLIAMIFCFGQIILYMFVFFRKFWYHLAGFGVVIIAIAAYLIFVPGVDTTVSMPAPDDATFSASASAVLTDEDYGEVRIIDPASGYIEVKSHKMGDTELIITDGEKTYRYNVSTFINDQGVCLVDIIPAEQ